MSQEKIKCPKCGHMIELSEAISHDIEDRVKTQYELEKTEGSVLEIRK